MIRSFGDKATEDLYHGQRSARAQRLPREIQKSALVKLDWIEHAKTLQDLRVPLSNHLEALKGKLHGYHSVRINKQWRIVFRWTAGDAYDVKIVDYH